MADEIYTWSDYRAKVREFDAVLEHGRAAAAALNGLQVAAPHVGYGAQIFVKLLSHCVALRRLAPDPGQQAPQALWDLPSMCSVARCVIEAHDTFEYIAGHGVSELERGFRIRLWELHDATRRLQILASLGAAAPAVAAIRADAARLQLALEAHEFLAAMPDVTQAALRLRLRRNDPPDFHLTRRQRCEISGVDADWHKAITLQLSQHVQTLPFSVHQVLQFQAGTPDVLRLTGQPLVFSLPFLVRAIQTMDQLAPLRIPKPPSRTARTMAVWRELARRGMKDAA
jgi:hypothetical protein